MELIERKYEILPTLNFYTDVSKIILDTLRHNCRTLEVYNMVAIKFFEFCTRFQCRKEFIRLSETINAHYTQIMKAQKQPESMPAARYPNPIRTQDEE
jgi:hypothetical protein